MCNGPTWCRASPTAHCCKELFTRDGVGTLVTSEPYEQLRPAVIDDVAGILELLRPLEEAGVLVRRSRELLETEIGHFSVLDRDGMAVGCAGLYPFRGRHGRACLPGGTSGLPTADAATSCSPPSSDQARRRA